MIRIHRLLDLGVAINEEGLTRRQEDALLIIHDEIERARAEKAEKK